MWHGTLEKLFCFSKQNESKLYFIPGFFCLWLMVLHSFYSISPCQGRFGFLLFGTILLFEINSMKLNKLLFIGFISFLNGYFFGVQGIQNFWELGWLVSMHLTICIAYCILSERKKVFAKEEENQQKMEKMPLATEKFYFYFEFFNRNV